MARKAKAESSRIKNRRAGFRYEILEKLPCGIVLKGTEVKSLRAGQASLDEAFARIRDAELWLCGMHIAPYKHGPVESHEPLRMRKLLARRGEIKKLMPKVAQRGLTLVPLEVYFNERGLAKVTLAVARGKATHDKRESIKKREAKRDMERAMRRRR